MSNGLRVVTFINLEHMWETVAESDLTGLYGVFVPGDFKMSMLCLFIL
jgi:hypothetical protein